MAIREKLAVENPAVTEFRSRLAQSQNNLGRLLAGLGKPSEAEAAYRASRSLYQDLAEANPTVPEYRNMWAAGHTNLADLVRALGRLHRGPRRLRPRHRPASTARRGGPEDADLSE